MPIPDIDSFNGLTSREVAEKLKNEGFNELPEAKKRSVAWIIFDVVHEPMFILLVAGGLIYFLLGDISEGLMLMSFVIFIIAITDIEHYLRLKQERANTTIVYVMIIYLSFGIYLYTAYQLNVPFLASFNNETMNLNIDTAGNLSEMFRIGIILGAFSGIMAGQFSSNSILAGFKHSIVLLAAALVLFVFVM